MLSVDAIALALHTGHMAGDAGEVEQIFCSSEQGAGIAFAAVTVLSPAFVDVSQCDVEALNSLVAAMIRQTSRLISKPEVCKECP